MKINKDTKISIEDNSISIKDCFGTSSAELSKKQLLTLGIALIIAIFN